MAENVRRAYFLKISPGVTPTCLGITPPRLVQMSNFGLIYGWLPLCEATLLLRVVPCWSVVSGPCDVQCTIASDKVNKQILGIWKVAFSFHAQSRS